MISIKNIAEKCGVSIATVSKALNNHTDISEATRERIRIAAKEMGYMPNSQARALKTNKTYNIGVLFVDKAESGFNHNYFAPILTSFKAEIEKMGYDITFISRLIGNNSMSYYEHCKYRNVDGVMVACMDFYDDEVIELINSDIPLVAIDFLSDKHCSISSDNALGMQNLIQYIYAKGHKKIAYIYGDTSQISSIRLNTFIDTMKDLGLEVCPQYIKQGRYHDPIGVQKLTREILELPVPPTCILMPDDFSAIGAMSTIEEMGLKIPDDISIAGYDGIYLSQIIKPPLTTIKQNTYIIGKKAADVLIKLVRKEEIFNEAKGFIIRGEFLEGETVKNIL